MVRSTSFLNTKHQTVPNCLLTLAPRHLVPSSGLCGHCTNICTYTCRQHTHINKNLTGNKTQTWAKKRISHWTQEDRSFSEAVTVFSGTKAVMSHLVRSQPSRQVLSSTHNVTGPRKPLSLAKPCAQSSHWKCSLDLWEHTELSLHIRSEKFGI